MTGAQLKLVLAARVEVDESTGTPIPPLFLFSIFFNSFLFLLFFFLTLFPLPPLFENYLPSFFPGLDAFSPRYPRCKLG